MNKSIIDVICGEGNSKKIELCLFVNLNSSNRGCVIYKKLDKDPEYYAAHYDSFNLECSKFDYDFTESEKQELYVIFRELVEV